MIIHCDTVIHIFLLSDMDITFIVLKSIYLFSFTFRVITSNIRNAKRGWINELGSWITKQLIQGYHQHGVGLRPAL